ncbi:MAG: hypothetical protein GY754_04965 [bacterium]|nr:hypothetical protein [bacterium]
MKLENSQTLDIDSKVELQNDYMPENPLQTSEKITFVHDNKNDQMQLFYIKDDKVYNARRESSTSSEYVIEDTHFPAKVKPHKVKSIVKDDTYYIFVTNGVDLYYMKESGFAKWTNIGGPHYKSKFDTIDKFDVALNSEGVIDVMTLTYSNDHVYCSALFSFSNMKWEDAKSGLRFFHWFHNMKDYILSGGVFVDEKNGKIQEIVTCDSYIAGNKWTNDTGIYIGKAADEGLNDTNCYLVAKGSYTQLAITESSVKNEPYLFSIDNSSKCSVCYFPLISEGKWDRIQMENVGIGIKDIAAVSEKDENGLQKPMVFALTINHSLTVTRTVPEKSAGNHSSALQWSDPVVIAKDTRWFSAEETKDGNAILAYEKTDGTFFVCYNDKKTHEWTHEELEAPGSSDKDVKETPCYYMTVLVKDKKLQAGIPGSLFTLRCNSIVDLEVNDDFVQLDHGFQYVGYTDSSGSIDLRILTRNNLSTPDFYLTTEEMDEGDYMVLSPDGNIRTKFRKSTVKDLQNAKRQDTHTKLLKDEYAKTSIVEEMKKGLSTVLGITDTIPQDNELSRKYLSDNTSASIARCVCSRERKKKEYIHAGKAFFLDFRPESIKNNKMCIELSGEQTTYLLAERENLDFLTVDWGDLWDSIKEGFIKIKDITIEVFKDTIKAVITFFNDTKWTGVIDFARMCMDLAQAIWQAAKVFFKDLFMWLCFLFDWDDIKKTAQVVKDAVFDAEDQFNHIFTEVIPNLTDSFFDNTKEFINDQFNSILELVKDMKLGDDTQKMQHSSDDFMDILPSSAFSYFNKSMSCLSNWELDLKKDNALKAAWEDFENIMKSIYSEKETQDLLNSFSEFFSSLTSRAAFDGTLVFDYFKAMESLILFIVVAAKKTVKAASDVLAGGMKIYKTFFEHSIDVPVISFIYESITGDKLTVINFLSFIIAIPYTIWYKLTYGEPPFSENMTLKDSSDARIGYNISGLARLFFTLVDTGLDSINLPNIDPPTGGAKFLGFSLPLIISGLTCRFWDTKKGKNLTTYEKWKIGTWSTGAALALFHPIYYLCFKKSLRSSVYGSWILFAFGAGQLTGGIGSIIYCKKETGKIDVDLAAHWISNPLPKLGKPLLNCPTPVVRTTLLCVDFGAGITDATVRLEYKK